MQTVTYLTSLILFWLKGSISQEQNFVRFKVPNTILGIIPLGSKKETIPINQLSVVTSSFSLKFKRLIIGVIVFFFSLALLLGEKTGEDAAAMIFGGLVLLLIALNVIITAFETKIAIETTSGRAKEIYFIIIEKKKANLVVDGINQLIANRLDDTNTRQQTDRIVDAINNK